MQFTKMHGAGNDYVYIDCFQEPVPKDPAALAVSISDRHKGIGSDGLILICPSEVADAQMRMFNADGSESAMCGNGIRCVAKYVFDHGICQKSRMQIETGAGILALDVEEPQCNCQAVPSKSEKETRRYYIRSSLISWSLPRSALLHSVLRSNSSRRA